MFKSARRNRSFGYQAGQSCQPMMPSMTQVLSISFVVMNKGAAIAAIGYALLAKSAFAWQPLVRVQPILITGFRRCLCWLCTNRCVYRSSSRTSYRVPMLSKADVLGLSLACTKHSYIVQSIEEPPKLLLLLSKLHKVADLALSHWCASQHPSKWCARTYQTYSQTDRKTNRTFRIKISWSKALLVQAKKPVLYVGGGVGMWKPHKRSKEFLQIL